MSRGSLRAGPPPSTGGATGGGDAVEGGAACSRGISDDRLMLGLQPDDEEEEGRALDQGEERSVLPRAAGGDSMLPVAAAGEHGDAAEGSSRVGSACSSRR
jgi:hypothetical protein